MPPKSIGSSISGGKPPSPFQRGISQPGSDEYSGGENARRLGHMRAHAPAG